MTAKWRCRLCRAKGHDGPVEWREHYTLRHEETGRGASATLGFAPTENFGVSGRWQGSSRVTPRAER